MKTRFAPSPTGLLHLGHAYSAWVAWELAGQRSDNFEVRIEDIDTVRSAPAFEQSIHDDLAWLGLTYPLPAMRQSERGDAYADALGHLANLGLTYPCACTRSDIAAAAAAPQEGVPTAAGVYPGTCRHRTGLAGPKDAVRLNMAAAIAFLGGDAGANGLTYLETGSQAPGRHALNAQYLRQAVGDIVLARKDIRTSYHLAVVVDDADQDITLVVRGLDLAEATPVHRLLQALLNLPVPDYHHHPLVRDSHGKRLAKRDDARAIAAFRAEGLSPVDVIARARAQASFDRA